MDKTASIPNIPTELRSSFMLTKTVSDASDNIPPTTGTTVDTVIFAVLTVKASALPLKMPERDKYPENTNSNIRRLFLIKFSKNLEKKRLKLSLPPRILRPVKSNMRFQISYII